MPTKIFIIAGNSQYYSLFCDIGWEAVSTIEKADLVCFTGGEDVSPSLYGEQRHPRTYHNMNRDDRETELFNQCLKNQTPMVGICRGGQFLNVMNGGKMYQDVSHHCQDHIIKCKKTNNVDRKSVV